MLFTPSACVFILLISVVILTQLSIVIDFLVLLLASYPRFFFSRDSPIIHEYLLSNQSKILQQQRIQMGREESSGQREYHPILVKIYQKEKIDLVAKEVTQILWLWAPLRCPSPNRGSGSAAAQRPIFPMKTYLVDVTNSCLVETS